MKDVPEKRDQIVRHFLFIDYWNQFIFYSTIFYLRYFREAFLSLISDMMMCCDWEILRILVDLIYEAIDRIGNFSIFRS